jgi:ABC-type proline/glycine betaine transport system permease subunit
MKLTSTEVAGVVRTITAAGFGLLVGMGIIDEQTAIDLAGAAGVIAVAIWSVWSKRKA